MLKLVIKKNDNEFWFDSVDEYKKFVRDENLSWNEFDLFRLV